MTITQKHLKSILSYNELNGNFTWVSYIGGSAKVGAVAGRLAYGYIGIQINEKKHQAHRLAWIYVNGDDSLSSADQIDHINHDRSDNRIENLRVVNRTGNQRNRSKNKNNTSGVCGVTWHKGTEKWQAQVGIKGVTKYLGSFSKKSDAILARKKANSENNFHINHGATK
jgi:hypothetical protein